MSAPPLLDLVLPCYNPQPGWVDRVVEGHRSLSGRIGFSPGLVLVNDGSRRGVGQAELDALRSALPGLRVEAYSPNRGKGYALRRGVALSQAEYVLYTDIDFPYVVDSMVAVWQALQGGADVAVGVKDAAYYRGVPPLRRFISRLLRALSGLLLRMPISDTQCGLKGFNRAGREVFLSTRIERYLFDLEFLYLAFRRPGLRVQAVPVSLREGVVFSPMRFSVLLQEAGNFARVWVGR
jgi:glycosyltransferase involved in cell wall biosynthesis